MTREEAIEVFENGSWWDYLDEYIDRDSMNELQNALDMAIAALREQEERRWIPVTERLPEVGKNVLVYSEYDGVSIDYHGGDSFGYALVTHWMPLPEQPKEE